MTDDRRIDLHAHTVHSDGTMTPTELVQHAAQIGLTALAVTDHDTTSALAEARAAGDAAGVEVLNGCEISCTIPSGVVHILTYGFDENDATFQSLLTRVRESRDERNLGILAKLAELELPLTIDEVRKHAFGRVVARPHFAAAMVERGYVDDVRDAFRRYLYDGGPAHALAEMPPPEEAIRAAERAGGVSVVAHPRQLRMGSRGAYRRLFRRFKEAGMSGVEVDHPSHKPEHRELFGELADELDLVASGGSDFHGSAKPHIRLGVGDGTIHVTYETWKHLKAQRAAA